MQRTREFVQAGTPVLLESGLIQREARERFYAKLDEAFIIPGSAH